eukprot:scaffold7672_cov220-Pinguiococcus_pyrenoidosus.AAC.3
MPAEHVRSRKQADPFHVSKLTSLFPDSTTSAVAGRWASWGTVTRFVTASGGWRCGRRAWRHTPYAPACRRRTSGPGPDPEVQKPTC